MNKKLEIGYVNGLFTVYAHGVYPNGQSSRIWMGDFLTLKEAKEAYPAAVVLGSALK